VSLYWASSAGVFVRRRAERRARKQKRICAGPQVREDADMTQMTKPETLQGGAAKIDYERNRGTIALSSCAALIVGTWPSISC
jgi:hypothetical protein